MGIFIILGLRWSTCISKDGPLQSLNSHPKDKPSKCKNPYSTFTIFIWIIFFRSSCLLSYILTVRYWYNTLTLDTFITSIHLYFLCAYAVTLLFLVNSTSIKSLETELFNTKNIVELLAKTPSAGCHKDISFKTMILVQVTLYTYYYWGNARQFLQNSWFISAAVIVQVLHLLALNFSMCCYRNCILSATQSLSECLNLVRHIMKSKKDEVRLLSTNFKTEEQPVNLAMIYEHILFRVPMLGTNDKCLFIFIIVYIIIHTHIYI